MWVIGRPAAGILKETALAIRNQERERGEGEKERKCENDHSAWRGNNLISGGASKLDSAIMQYFSVPL